MSVSIILVNYNTKNFTLQCLNSIYSHTKEVDFEIIVVDNNSSDQSVEAIKEGFQDVIVIENSENKGFGAANNIGIKYATKKFVFLLNTDTELISNSIMELFNRMESKEYEHILCAGVNIIYPDFEPQKSYGNYPSLKGIFLGMTGLKVFFRKHYDRHLATGKICDFDYVKEVDHIVGVAMFINKKKLVKQVGLFDEDFFLYFEETELCYRMIKNNFKICLFPDLKIIHHLSKSMSSNLKKHIYFERSRYLYFKKTGMRFPGLIKAVSFLSFVRYSLIEKDIKYIHSIKQLYEEK